MKIRLGIGSPSITGGLWGAGKQEATPNHFFDT